MGFREISSSNCTKFTAICPKPCPAFLKHVLRTSSHCQVLLNMRPILISVNSQLTLSLTFYTTRILFTLSYTGNKKTKQTRKRIANKFCVHVLVFNMRKGRNEKSAHKVKQKSYSTQCKIKCDVLCDFVPFLYKLKNVKTTHGGVEAFNFT